MRPRAALIGAVLVLAACAADTNESRPSVVYHTAPGGEPTTGGDGTPTSAAQAGEAPFLDHVAFTPFVSGIDRPVDLVWRKGDAALYVVSQGGTIIRIVDGKVSEKVLDVSAIAATAGEQGLLGMAFHPSEPLAYVDYTDTDGDTVIAEYAVADDGTFDAASARIVLTIDQPYDNHNGGKVVFGPDGYLYIGMGDGGLYADPERRALNPAELLGKLLRIDPVAKDGKPYTVPADNPFVGVAGARPEIWAVGLRNPWRFGFDSATGDLWIGDVGQDYIEEVDVAWASHGAGKGYNFGWSAYEGSQQFNKDQPTDGVTFPVHEYPHGDEGCAVTGGTVYRGTAIDGMQGWYVYADYCSGKVWALLTTEGSTTVTQVQLGTQPHAAALTAGPDGELYVLDIADGTIALITPA